MAVFQQQASGGRASEQQQGEAVGSAALPGRLGPVGNRGVGGEQHGGAWGGDGLFIVGSGRALQVVGGFVGGGLTAGASKRIRAGGG